MTVSRSCENLRAIFTPVFICKGANQFLLWKLSWELDWKSGEYSNNKNWVENWTENQVNIQKPPNTGSNLQYKNDLILNNIVQKIFHPKKKKKKQKKKKKIRKQIGVHSLYFWTKKFSRIQTFNKNWISSLS